MTITFKRKLVTLEYLSLAAGLGSLTSTTPNILIEKPGRDELLFLCTILCTLVLLYGLEMKVYEKLGSLKFRNGCNPGLWTCCLLPISLVLQIHQDENQIPPSAKHSWFNVIFGLRRKTRHQIQSKDRTSLQWMWYLTSLCTFASSLYLISAMCGTSNPKKLFRSTINKLNCIFLICIGLGMMYYLAEIEFKTSLYLSATSQLIFFFLSLNLPEYFPRAFSFGEVLLISQSLASFLTTSVYHIYQHLGSNQILSSTDQISLFIEICLLGSVLVIVLFALFCYCSRPSLFYAFVSLICAAFIFILPFLRFILRVNPFFWCFDFLVETNTRLSLLGLWCLLLMMSVLFVYSQSMTPNQPRTIMRKYFHLMIIGVYFPGLLFDHVFLRFSSALLLGIFLIIEFIRFFEFQPVSTSINRHFSFFLDDKDQGPLILSHIYLLVGCSIPVWFFTKGINSFAGILSVGIGDAFASIGGKMFGRHQWPGTKKTLEGTACSICGQLLAVNILEKTGVFPLNSTPAVAGIVISTSLLEAFTTQIDNLVVPMVFLLLLAPVVRINGLN